MIDNGLDKVKAYKTVYPKAAESTANVNSTKLLKTEIVQQELAKQAERYTPEFIISSIGDIAENSTKDDTKLRALELLGKARSVFRNDQPTQAINVLAQFDSVDNRKELGLDKPKVIELSDVQPSVEQPKPNDSNGLGNT